MLSVIVVETGKGWAYCLSVYLAPFSWESQGFFIFKSDAFLEAEFKQSPGMRLNTFQ